jgi:hypothetical protein
MTTEEKKAYDKEYREQNKEKLAAKKKEYYEQNKEKVLVKKKEYYEQNKEKLAENGKEYREQNKEKILARVKNWTKENKEKVLVKQKEYREKNKEKIADGKKNHYSQNKEKVLTKNKEYREQNKEKLAAKSKEYQKLRLQTDPVYKLTTMCRNRIRGYFNSKGIKKSKATMEMLGCTPEELRDHLQSQFTEGMTLENHGDWHIDHIIPLASANTEEEIVKLCHYTNLQPLWAEDNLSKSDKIIN